MVGDDADGRDQDSRSRIGVACSNAPDECPKVACVVASDVSLDDVAQHFGHESTTGQCPRCGGALIHYEVDLSERSVMP